MEKVEDWMITSLLAGFLVARIDSWLKNDAGRVLDAKFLTLCRARGTDITPEFLHQMKEDARQLGVPEEVLTIPEEDKAEMIRLIPFAQALTQALQIRIRRTDTDTADGGAVGGSGARGPRPN